MDETTIGIGVFFPSLHTRRIAEGAIAGLERAAAHYPGRRPIAEVFWTYNRFLEAVRAGQIAGAVIYANYHEVAFGLRRIPAAGTLGIPLLDTANRYHQPPLPAVVPDDERIGRVAARLFHERGCSHALFVGFPEDYRFSSLRRIGFEGEAGARGLELLPAQTHSVSARPSGRLAARSLETLPARTGIFAANDEVAKLVWRVLRSMERRVPEDVLLLGVDNEFALTSPSGGIISSIDPGGFAVGKRAALALAAHLFEGQALRREVVAGYQAIHERDSTLPSPARDPVVSRALSMASPDIADVQAWAKKVRISSRTLERHFRNALGCSPRAYLAERRIERAKQLLLTTDWTIERVAADAGFSEPKWFFQAFRRATGRTPGAFRSVH